LADTIFALATARGRAGIAVIRISGPAAFAASATLAGVRPRPRAPSLRWLRDPATGARLDRGIVLAFPGPGSFTGEDTVELQLHGGPAVCRSVLEALAGIAGLRLAEPGEFSRRALVNGRLDLAQAEGLGDLIAAETAAQQRQAVRMMDGALSRLGTDWGAELIRALAQVEASIDFADEELPTDLYASAGRSIGKVAAAMERELAGSRVAERIRDGFEVALIGPPNVGKSTLLNALAGREVALTSEVAGTTRDVIEVRLDLDGLALTLLDTAGLRAEGERLEMLGIDRARSRAAAADLRVFLVEDAAEAVELGVPMQPGDLTVLAKADRRTAADGLAVSGLTGAGIDRLLAEISATLGERAATAGTVSHARQREAVERARAAVGRAAAELAAVAPRAEIAAEELRAALRALDFLLGKVDVEAVLDVVFQSFCLGK
jgi:tRNA modification GTPase